ncbi:hypothetical protein [Halomicrobium salinisoli]|nr:hypothetical protein [Halomicrobium salinisoli]
MSSDDTVHFVEDLEERQNASIVAPTTLAVGEEAGDGPMTMSCQETGC